MTLFSSTQPSLRARVLPRFPANVVAGTGINIVKSGSTYTFSASSAFFGREQLEADRTYYVATTGSDSNDGLTAIAPFATLQGAYDAISRAIDFSGYTVTVRVAAGTYDRLSIIGTNPIGLGLLRFIGDTATPSNVVINSSGSCFEGGDTNPNNMLISGFKLISSAGNGILCQGGSNFAVSSMEYGACAGAHIQAYGTGSAVYLNGSNFTISGGALLHLYADAGGLIDTFDTISYNLTGAPNFGDAFVGASRCGIIYLDMTAITFIGAATGKSYSGTMNGVLELYGLDANLPGSLAGTLTTGAQLD